ncbi:hypothetical protein AVEN_199719-1 [Araneus ventricosus]|uniref:Uncharacterized protein n=1 Tax=Araneus ventricosus TaxID=182803 RepID=A0A4Y1ZRE7_ARAVE|nr:hypothetical protein AVEN_126548-1 [Araneus ventricosus]GBL64348.1 hypothetical protein AVEN_199719-1 [Araneus ventricosus]
MLGLLIFHVLKSIKNTEKFIFRWHCEVSPSSFPRQQGHTRDPRSGEEGHKTSREKRPVLYKPRGGSEENDSGIVCLYPRSGADKDGQLRVTVSNDSLEGRRTTAVGWFVQMVDKSLEINSSATYLSSEGRCLRKEDDRRRGERDDS